MQKHIYFSIIITTCIFSNNLFSAASAESSSPITETSKKEMTRAEKRAAKMAQAKIDAEERREKVLNPGALLKKVVIAATNEKLLPASLTRSNARMAELAEQFEGFGDKGRRREPNR